MTLLLVLLGGAVGAPLRYLVDRALQARHDSVFPWGTLSVNVTGSALLGLLAGGASAGALPDAALPLLATGLAGALTTFSTFGWETLRLLEDGALAEAVLNVLASLAAGLVAVTAGWVLAASLW